MSFWDNSSVLLPQPKNGCNRQVALHLPIVRKNWLESIVLKQKSIAFGSCPRKFNELIFKAPFSLGFNSVTPGALHRDLQVGSPTAPASAFLSSSLLLVRAQNKKTFQARVSTQHKSAPSPWRKGTQCWFSRGRKADPSFASQRTKSLLDVLRSTLPNTG